MNPVRHPQTLLGSVQRTSRRVFVRSQRKKQRRVSLISFPPYFSAAPLLSETNYLRSSSLHEHWRIIRMVSFQPQQCQLGGGKRKREKGLGRSYLDKTQHQFYIGVDHRLCVFCRRSTSLSLSSTRIIVERGKRSYYHINTRWMDKWDQFAMIGKDRMRTRKAKKRGRRR